MIKLNCVKMLVFQTHFVYWQEIYSGCLDLGNKIKLVYEFATDNNFVFSKPRIYFVMFPFLLWEDLHIPCYAQISLERSSRKIQSNLCWMEKCNLFLSRNVLLCDVISNLIHSFNFFSVKKTLKVSILLSIAHMFIQQNYVVIY